MNIKIFKEEDSIQLLIQKLLIQLLIQKSIRKYIVLSEENISQEFRLENIDETRHLIEKVN